MSNGSGFEIWKDVPCSDGSYQVSNQGRVKRVKKKVVSHGKEVISKRERILKPYLNNGYPEVMITINGNMEKQRVHRLVAKAFLLNINEYSQVDHINHCKTDNRVSNLRWCNDRINQRNRESNRVLKAFGKEKLVCEWAEIYGICPSTIDKRIKRGWSVEDAISKPIQRKKG